MNGVMTPFQRLLDSDTAMVAGDPLGPAEDVILVAEDGGEHPVRAFFDYPGLDVTPGGSQAPIASAAPVLHIQVAVVKKALARKLTTRDGFRARGSLWRVQRPQPDGCGMLAVKLLEKGE